jgi:MFS family permease
MTYDGSSSHASPTLWNRTYLGLLAAQFLAAFNDQAIHAAAMFYAINTQTLTESQAISLMPILFYAPWALFCTLAGYLSDRFSKRATLVFWKVAEVAITGLALFGFWIGTDGGSPQLGAWVVLSTVFLMGTHSAFFVPAKYGVMPEILQPQLLSRGNGLLESLSFLAVILGTVTGGVMSFLFLRREVNIGIVLLALAVIGAVASLLIRKMPAANPTLKFPPYLYGPLYRNLKVLITSRPLSFAVIGIAFFTFIVAFMRATVYMLGESQNPRWDELKTSAVVGTVALGVGLGSPLAGWLSGKKVELGLIPLGAFGMIVGCVAAGFSLGYVPGLVASTILIGVCTGFYLVPLFTLLQHRAPKSSKGDMIATSNFINVTGAIAASLLFFVLVFAAKKTDFIPKIDSEQDVAEGVLTEKLLSHGRPVYVVVGDKPFGEKPAEEAGFDIVDHLFGEKPVETPPMIEVSRTVAVGDAVRVRFYELNGVKHFTVSGTSESPQVHYDARNLPRFLFLGAGLMTFGVIVILWRRVRDLPTRAVGLIASTTGIRYSPEGLHHVPGDGPLLLLLDFQDPIATRAALGAVDRHATLLSGADDARAIAIFRRGDIVAVRANDPKLPSLLHAIPPHERVIVRLIGTVLDFQTQ